eukprot:m.312476 g.312476  ORF g.312476 m.312476 type:complete len:50 (+) comp268019_c0_seq1:170-319(+)
MENGTLYEKMVGNVNFMGWKDRGPVLLVSAIHLIGRNTSVVLGSYDYGR